MKKCISIDDFMLCGLNHSKEEIQQILNNQKIVSFLKLCMMKDWDIDSDDIEHILDLNFDYVKKANMIESTYDTIDEALEDIPKL